MIHRLIGVAIAGALLAGGAFSPPVLAELGLRSTHAATRTLAIKPSERLDAVSPNLFGARYGTSRPFATTTLRQTTTGASNSVALTHNHEVAWVELALEKSEIRADARNTKLQLRIIAHDLTTRSSSDRVHISIGTIDRSRF
jgi:hypothetical protein